MPVTGLAGTGLPGMPATTPAPATAAAPGACLVGHWQATDLVQLIRRNLPAGLSRDGQLTRGSGTIDLEFRAPDATGQSMLVVTPSDLVHTATIQQEGVTITATLTLVGSATMPWASPTADTLQVSETTQSDLQLRGSIRTSIGFGESARRPERVHLDGTYLYECSPTQASVWDRSPDGARQGDPIMLTRAP